MPKNERVMLNDSAIDVSGSTLVHVSEAECDCLRANCRGCDDEREDEPCRECNGSQLSVRFNGYSGLRPVWEEVDCAYCGGTGRGCEERGG